MPLSPIWGAWLSQAAGAHCSADMELWVASQKKGGARGCRQHFWRRRCRITQPPKYDTVRTTPYPVRIRGFYSAASQVAVIRATYLELRRIMRLEDVVPSDLKGTKVPKALLAVVHAQAKCCVARDLSE